MTRYIAGNDPGDEQPTPGPWVIDNRSVFEAEPAPNTGKLALGHVVAECPTAFGGHTVRAPQTAPLPCPAKEVLDAQGLANARLVAAAPEMLAALRSAWIAFTKASGRSTATSRIDSPECHAAIEAIEAAIVKAQSRS